jgi:hypothetical protein
MRFQSIGGIAYHQKGNFPKLIIHSGTHGDEYHVIAPLKRVVARLYNELPDFIYVPEVSPSAVALKTRINGRKNDLNRVFWQANDDPEIVANKQIIAPASGAIAITFHHDIGHNDAGENTYYMYDSAKLSEQQLSWLQESLKAVKIPLLNGVDDPYDEDLSTHFVDGYVSIQSQPTFEGTFIDDWARYHSHVSRMLTVEVPYDHVALEKSLEITLRLAIELVSELNEENSGFLTEESIL